MLEDVTHLFIKKDTSEEERVQLAELVLRATEDANEKDLLYNQHNGEDSIEIIQDARDTDEVESNRAPEDTFSPDTTYEVFKDSLRDLRTQIELLKEELDARGSTVEFTLSKNELPPENIEEDICDHDSLLDWHKKVQSMVKIQQLNDALKNIKNTLPSLDKETVMKELHDLEVKIQTLEQKVVAREKILTVDPRSN